MEKIWIKKELYLENYEFLNILYFSDFYLRFKLIFYMSISLFKSQKGVYLPTGADVASGTGWRADVARGTTARMRCGSEAMWQGRGWPTRGAGGAHGTYTWQEATRVHASPRWGPCGAPRGRGSAGARPMG